jgi:high-affinity K+ transport system ATPase subunit B
MCVTSYKRYRRRQIAYGQWRPRVPVATARAHVEALIEAGLRPTHVADLAGINATTVSNITHPATSRIQAEIERAVLAVPIPDRPGDVTADNALVPITGACRRFQALIAVGVLGLDDQLRPDSHATVQTLTTLTGTTPVLLTGDNQRAATALATRIGIEDVRAGLLPQDKVTAVRELEATGRVLLVGDGVNDAPALAAAHTGIAMGRAGSDLALETADAVVVRDELATIPKVIALSRRARRVVIANLVIASTFITVLVLWDLLGHLPLPLGVAGHEGSTVIVGLNGMRLLARRAWTPRGSGPR